MFAKMLHFEESAFFLQVESSIYYMTFTLDLFTKICYKYKVNYTKRS